MAMTIVATTTTGTTTGTVPVQVPPNTRKPLELPLLVFPLAAALVALKPLSDPDVYWHLAAGELIAGQGLVDKDPWSFASSNTWLLHEWLSELAMYGSYTVGGYAGVATLRAAVVGALVAFILISCRRVARPDIAAVVGTLALFATLPSSAERPQLLSWLLLAAVCPWLRRCVARGQVPWALIPITWLWANLHGLWLTALVLYGALLVGLVTDLGRDRWRQARRFVAVGLGSALVPALTPVGPRLLTAPLHVREYARFVTEWEPPSVMSPATAGALAIAAVVVVGWAREGSRVDAPTIAFVGAATAMGLSYSRTVPVLAIAVAPLAAETLQRWTGHDRPPVSFNRRVWIEWGVVAVTGAVLFAVLLPRTESVTALMSSPGTSEQRMRTASHELDQLPGRARVINEYEIGGWLLWNARDTSPAIDGRTEIYEVDYVADYINALAARPGWEEFTNKLHADAALLHSSTPLASGLKSQGWRVLSDDEELVVLVPPGRERSYDPDAVQ